ncbi:MAG: hypothetical protein MMC33_007209 [Icmadophila ericetorum]|nr:hypothetical protein [Icmadophila ericetorum]
MTTNSVCTTSDLSQPTEPPTNIVLITGANQGIGYESVKKLLATHPSYHLLMGCRSLARGYSAIATLPPEHQRRVTPLELDITSDASIAAAVGTLTRSFGRLDVLVHNAGVFAVSASTTRAVFTTTLDVNTASAACLTEACLPLLRRSPNPRIVFVSSSLGSITRTAQRYTDRPVAYRCSKAALNMLAVCYAQALRAEGMAVNVCNPGLNATKLVRGGVEGGEHPSVGAVNVCRLVGLGKGEATGTYSSKDGELPW